MCSYELQHHWIWMQHAATHKHARTDHTYNVQYGNDLGEAGAQYLATALEQLRSIKVLKLVSGLFSESQCGLSRI